MPRKPVLLALGSVVVFAGVSMSQPPADITPQSAPGVRIQLRPGEPREIVVAPRGVGICTSRGRGCFEHFTVTWVAPGGTDDERIRVTFTTPGSSDCLDLPSGGSFTIHRINDPVRIEARPSCPTKSAFFYTVSCEGGAGGDCGGVQPVDPGAMVEGPSG